MSVRRPVKTGATYDDLLAVPENLVAEMLDGELSIAPHWICEVLSPATEAIDRAKKLPIYAREDVAHAWLVNPVLRTLEVLSLDLQRWTLAATYEGNAKARAAPFEAAVLELAALWV